MSFVLEGEGEEDVYVFFFFKVSGDSYFLIVIDCGSKKRFMMVIRRR